MSNEVVSNTGRGRARGRARGQPTPQSTSQPAPLLPIQQIPVVPHVVPVGTVDARGNTVSAVGRADTRGGSTGGLESKLAGLQVKEVNPRGDNETESTRGGVSRKLMRYQEHQTRPNPEQSKTGSVGEMVDLIANYLPLLLKPGWDAYQYHVDFLPFLGSKPMREKLLQESDLFHGKPFVYDGGCLYSIAFIPEPVKNLGKIGRWEGEYTVKPVGKIIAGTPQYLHLVNIIYNSAQSFMAMEMVDRDYYYPALSMKLPKFGIEIWPGFEASIGSTDGPLMLHFDVKHKVLHTKTVLSVMYEIYHSQPNMPTSIFHGKVKDSLVGQRVMTRYNKKIYSIDDIDWDARVKDTFERFEKGETKAISYKQYFEQTYNVTLSDGDQPMIVSVPKKRDLPPQKGDKQRREQTNIYLPPELCFLTGTSDEMRADRNFMKDMAEITRLNPQDRYNKLSNFNKELQGNALCKEHMLKWDLKFSPDLLNFKGRVLPPETIFMSREIKYNPERASWDNDLKSNALFQPISCNNWIFLYGSRDEQVARDLCNALQRVSQGLGMVIGNPIVIPIRDDRDQTWIQAIEENTKADTQLVFALMGTNKKQRYDAIKKQCCIRKPVPSQCVLVKTVRMQAKVMAVATKVAIQISCKLGGGAWAVKVPIKNTMIIGMDTFHDKRQSISIQGIVFSLDDKWTRYYSRAPVTRSTGGKQELQHHLDKLMESGLKKYQEVNGVLPDKIVVFRDGVGDGNLAMVREGEVKSMQRAFARIHENYKPHFKFVVVKKRITTRFFRKTPRGLMNPVPGTVVDTQITKPGFYDFFLVSQSVGQGTVTPSHYNVIHDECPLKPDHVQQLAYKLCHLYYNWPGTIRVPAPCHYAHRLAYLVGENLLEEHSPQIADRLFYL